MILVEPFSDEQILERFLFYCEQCDLFLRHVGHRHPSARLRYDPVVMFNVVQSTMDDIWRFKVYHQEDPTLLSDSVKRAAYFTKWVVQHRPIYHDRTSTWVDGDPSIPDDDPTLMLNEQFAIQRALCTIATEIRVEHICLDPDFRADLLYDLHYRSLSGNALIAIYSVIRTTASGGSIVMKTIPPEDDAIEGDAAR